MRYILTLLIALLSLNINAQVYSVDGYVTDEETGEALIAASVYSLKDQIGVITDAQGYYTIELETRDQQLTFSYIGYVEKSVKVESEKINVQLKTSLEEIEEVQISAYADKNVKEVQMSVSKLDMAVVQKLPAFLGEKDIVKSIQLLPGVTSVGEGASGFNVRGGSIDQNLVLLDKAPIFNSSHLFGFFSVFNPDAVQDAQLYKGGIPARYGGRLSSILDVQLKEASDSEFEMNGGVGTIFSRLSVETPIIKDKSNLIIAGRRSYIDVLAKPFLSDDLSGSALNFYDLTLRSNNDLSDKDKLYLSGYLGRDNFAFGDNAGFNWGNKTASLQWKHIYNDKWSSNLTTYASKYDYQINFGDTAEDTFDWSAAIINYSAQLDFSHFINEHNVVRLGAQSIYYIFEPANAISVSNSRSIDFSVDKQFGIESSAYLENEIALIEELKINYGLRLSHFAYLGGRKEYVYDENSTTGLGKTLVSEEYVAKGKVIKSYYNFEPRVGVNIAFADDKSFKLSYNRTSQYLHLLSNTTASTPVDIWTPSTNNVKPQLADQFALGYFQNFDGNAYELSTEVYYKNMKQLVDYVDGADLVLNEYVEGQLLEGKGRAYGVELQLKKNTGKFTGWLSYTLARTERKVNGVNSNQWYPSRFDKTNNLSLTGIYDINDRWTISSTFTYATGTPTTLASARYNQNGVFVPYNASNQRNNFRVPDYHRLDIAATLNPKKSSKRWKGTWIFGVYNAYARKNPFSIYGNIQSERPTEGKPIKTKYEQLSVVGSFIPSISYNFKFK